MDHPDPHNSVPPLFDLMTRFSRQTEKDFLIKLSGTMLVGCDGKKVKDFHKDHNFLYRKGF